jgi:hypothetical protein
MVLGRLWPERAIAYSATAMALSRLRCLTAAAAISTATILAGRNAVSADEPAPRLVRYQDDALTVRVTDMPLTEVLDELNRQSGAEIRGEPREARNVQADFENVPLAQALARLLPDQNFALVYGKGGRLERIRLIGGTGEPTAFRVAVAPVKPSAQEPSDALGRLTELIDHHPPVAVDGALADAVGSGRATLRQLIDLSLHHEDESVRAEAMRVGMATLDREPDFRSAVMGELHKVDSSVLTAVLRGSGSDHAEDVAMQVLDLGGSPDFRLMLSSVVQRLRAGL